LIVADPMPKRITMPWFSRSLALVVLLGVGLTLPATGQIPNLKKVKEATKKAAKPADTAATKAATPGPTPNAQPTGQAQQAGSRVWENYDFVPGNRVIFFTDFSEDKVGNFANRLRFVGGAMDVVEVDGVRMLRSTARSQFLIPVGKKLPERFTIEFDIIAPNMTGYEVLNFEGGARLDRGDASAEVVWHPTSAMIIGSGQGAAGQVKFPEALQAVTIDYPAHVRVLMDGPYFKMYTNERRLYNIPQLSFKRDSVIRVFLNGAEEEGQAVYLASIRVAESQVDVLYDALATRGRWSTQGILFATGKAELRPESRPVLKEIAAALKAHTDLKVLIEGHTDNVGGAAANLALSDARAAAVKAALVTDFGIPAEQITTKGLGDTKPAAPNTTAEGRAQNRRVEVVKQ
jgi:outer membrane protein OmpA-like peptidoglycan-associated protein